MSLDNIHRLVYVLKHNVSETGLCLRPQVKTYSVRSNRQASPYLRTDSDTLYIKLILIII
jgi:hypothetical protein